MSSINKNGGGIPISTIRHSFSHVMAHAVLDMFPDAQIAIGPAIENGFYYDFELPRKLEDEDLRSIEERMRGLIGEGLPITRKEVSREEARLLFKDQKYKLELIDAIADDVPISVYTVGRFTDLCKGPHVESTGKLRADSFKILSVAGAYWRGDERNKMLTRIYATAFESPRELKAYLEKLEEIRLRDHRRLGVQLDLFSTHEEAGPGLIYWHPRGARVRNEIETFWREEHIKNGYDLVYTPHVGKSWLWETSGHLDFYKESMYSPMQMDKSDYYVKPMNCPFAIMIYKNSKHSYRELPFRWAELGTVYRYEKQGSLHGLMRVRGFTQDDAHIFCTSEQMESEIAEALSFAIGMLKRFGFSKFKAFLSTKPEKSVGSTSDWQAAEASLRNAINKEGLEFEVDEGGGAFYGPKIDLKIEDPVGRLWQLSTIQFDFNLPERFGLSYVDKDGTEKRPYMIHRALLGSIERFFGVLIEHYKGAFPLWLSPDQAVVIPVSQSQDEYVRHVVSSLKAAGVRAYGDFRDDRMNAKIRDASGMKIPYVLVVGDREKESGTVSVRNFASKAVRNAMPLDDLINEMTEKIRSKALQ